MLLERVCSNCEWFVAGQGPGTCRRRAPTAEILAGLAFAAAAWPQVQQDDWCGDFRAAEAKLADIEGDAETPQPAPPAPSPAPGGTKVDVGWDRRP